MPQANPIMVLVFKLLNMLTFGALYPYNAILIKPHNNVDKYEIVPYRIQKGKSGADIIFFENGFYYPVPEGNMSYCIIKGKQGAIFGFNGNSVWNIKVNSKEQVLEMLSDINTDSYITFQTLSELSERFRSKEESQRLFMIALATIAVVGLINAILAYIIWDNINKIEAQKAGVMATIKDLERIKLYEIAYAYNVSFPEYDINPFNKTKKTNPLPNQQIQLPIQLPQ